MGKKNKKTVITYTQGKQYKVKLRGKVSSKGDISLYLDYYLGIKKDENGKTKAIRKFEFLDIHLKENPKTAKDRADNKKFLTLAEEIRTRRQTDFQYNSHGFISPNKGNINFIDYFQNFLDQYPNKDIRIVKYCFRYFKDFVGSDFIAPVEVTESFLIRFKTYLEENLNGETPHNYFTKMKKVMKQAYNDGVIQVNPAVNIKNTRKEGLKKDIIGIEEIELLAKTPCGNEEVKDAFMFSLNTGLRFSDIVKLKWRNVNGDQIKVDQSKTDEQVFIDLNSTAKRILDKKPGSIDEPIFNLPSFTSCIKTLKRWAKKAGVEKNLTWHSARHSIAVILLTQGADIKTVSGILGHKSIRHTEKYTRVIDELKRKAINSMPDIDY